MTFQDIFRSTFIDNVAVIPMFDMVLAMALALCLGLFIDFNLLRAQSVRKQLNGDIQRTNEGQRIDQSNFVDASHINIFDLGDLEDLTR